jgi:hypothetical protein
MLGLTTTAVVIRAFRAHCQEAIWTTILLICYTKHSASEDVDSEEIKKCARNVQGRKPANTSAIFIVELF